MDAAKPNDRMIEDCFEEILRKKNSWSSLKFTAKQSLLKNAILPDGYERECREV